MKSVFVRTALLAVASIILVAACGQKPAAPAAAGSPPAATAGHPAAATLDTDLDMDDEKIVNMYNWSDYIDLAVLAEFTRETGIKVNYDVFDSNEMLETKLLAGTPPPSRSGTAVPTRVPRTSAGPGPGSACRARVGWWR